MTAIANSIDLTNHFLIAMPGMADPHFSKTLTYICEHTPQGAIGLIVNKPMAMHITLASLFDQVAITLPSADLRLRETNVLYGGPVLMDRGFVLHQPVGDWHSTLKVTENTGLTTSRDILESIAKGEGPGRILVTLGYAGWGPGQLEDEIGRNGWLNTPASTNLMFDLPYEARLTAAMGLMGLNYGNLIDTAGHA